MALQYPGISYLRGYDGSVSDIFDAWNKGEAKGLSDRNERDARDTLGQWVSSLYGDTTGADGAVRAGMAMHPGQGEIRPNSSGAKPDTLDTLSGLVNGSHDAVELTRDPRTSAALDARYGQQPAPTLVASADSNDPAMSSYMTSARAAESGGNNYAKNPKSSALGPYQFLDDTWTGLMQQHPDLGLTPDGRTDPAQAEAAMRAFTRDNMKALRDADIAINPTSLYAAHFLGAGGASRVLQAATDTPMASLVSPAVLQANPQLADMTQDDFIQWASSKSGNGTAGYAAPRVGTNGSFASPMRQVPLPSREVLTALMQNPETRAFGASLVEQARKSSTADQFQTFKGANGDLMQVNLLTGETKVLQDGAKPTTPTDDQRELAQINEERTAAGEPKLKMEEYLAAKSGGGFSVTTNPDGTVSVSQGKGMKLTEGQGKDLGFYTRGIDANKQLSTMDSQLTSLVQAKADIVPLGLGNYLRTPEFRQAKVAADGFLTAILRKDTGAAITDKEFELYGPMFLPIPGDDQGTVEQKRRMREVALLGIRSGLGTADAIAEANRIALGIESATPIIDGQQGTAPPAAAAATGGGGAQLPDPFGLRGQ